MSNFEYGTYFFRPQSNDFFINSEFTHPETLNVDYVRNWMRMGRIRNKWGIKDYHHELFHYVIIPCILSFTASSHQDYVVMSYRDEYHMTMYLSLVEKLIEMEFLVKLLPHEEASSEFGLI